MHNAHDFFQWQDGDLHHLLLFWKLHHELFLICETRLGLD